MKGSDVTVTVRARVHKHTLFSACNDMPEKIMAERYLYTLFCELCYLTKGQFATLMLLKLSANSGVHDIRKINREDFLWLRYSIISPFFCLSICKTTFQNLSSTIFVGLLCLIMNALRKTFSNCFSSNRFQPICYHYKRVMIRGPAFGLYS